MSMVRRRGKWLPVIGSLMVLEFDEALLGCSFFALVRFFATLDEEDEVQDPAVE